MLDLIKEYMLKIWESIMKFSIMFYTYIKNHKTPVISLLFLLTYVILYYILSFHSSKIIAEKYEYYTNIIFLIIAIIWGVSIIFKFMNDDDKINSKILYFSKYVFGITLIISLFFLILYFLSSSILLNSVVSFIINVGLIVFGLYIISYFIRKSSYYNSIKKHPLWSKIYNVVFSIPQYIVGSYLFVKNDITNTPNFIYKIFGIEILFIIAYFLVPYLTTKLFTNNSTILLNEPVFTDKQHTVGTFENLHKETTENEDNPYLNYNYCISAWVFLDNVGPNYSSVSNNYASIINYGNNPKISYNGKIHELRVTMEKGRDENNDEVIYSTKKILLQKWNNIVVNYDSGITDIFINGVLVSSKNKILPYLTMDNVIVGEQHGYPGGVCNLIYHKSPLSKSKIKMFYELLKDKTPPHY